jgi:DNA modification methylase
MDRGDKMIERQKITNEYAIYNGDSIELMKDMPNESIDLSIYSPPFMGLYHYSSSDRDLSNCDSYEAFFTHYAFFVSELARLTKPGRCTAVHCMDVPSGNTGSDTYTDFPGDIIRLHEKHGFRMKCRHFVWKEPLAVRNRTMQKNLAHKTIIDDSIDAGVATADQVIIFQKAGENKVPVEHPNGLMYYAGSDKMPEELLQYRGFKGDQKQNRYSHYIWRRYASSFWTDVVVDRVLPFKQSRDEKDEKHVHPLQLDVINRIIVLRSNPGEIVFTPFMGVGSEVYCAVMNGRKGVGCELKPTYYDQAVRNLESVNYTMYDEDPSLALYDTEDME